MEKITFKNKTSILVLHDILKKFWHIYLLIGILAASTLVLQLVGVSIILHSFHGNAALPFGLDRLFAGFNNDTKIFIAFFVLLLSAILMFISRKLSVIMMIKYESLCANELICKVKQNISPLNNKSDNQLITLLTKDCRYGGRIVQEISNLVMPLGASIIAFPVLFYLSFKTTIVLIAILIITLIPFSMIAAKAKLVSSLLEKSAASDSQAKKDLLKKIRTNHTITEIPSIPHPDFKRAYHQRLLMPHIGILIGGVQLSLCLVALALLTSRSVFSGDITSIILYGLVAIFVFTQLRSSPKVFMNFHIFHAYFQRAFSIIKDIDMLQNETLAYNQNIQELHQEEDL